MDHRANDRSPGWRPPFSASGVLVRAVDRRVDAEPFAIDVSAHRLEEPVPLSGLCPSVETVEDALPRPKLVWKISPWYPRPSPPEDRLDEEAVVLRRPSHAIVSREERFDLLPLPVVEHRSNHRGPAMEHDFRRMDSPDFRDRP